MTLLAFSRAIALAGVLLAACSGGSAPPAPPRAAAPEPPAAPGKPVGAATPTGAPRAEATAAGPVTVRYGAISAVFPEFWDDFIAEEKGFWTANGIALETTITNTSAGGTQALVADAVDVANNSVDTLILAVEKGADLAHVADFVVTPTYGLVGAQDVRTYGDLRGKSIAISDLRSGPTIILKRMLAANGLSEDAVDLVPAGGSGSRFTALESGAVQAAMMVQPFDFQLVDRGFHLLGYSTEYVKKQTLNAGLVRRAWAERNAETLVRFLRAKKQAIDWLYDPAHKDEAIRLLAEKGRMAPELAARTYDLKITRERVFSAELVPDLEALQDVINVLGTLGDLSAPLPSPQKFVDARYAERARRS
jgi:ABC-type nitrate/sulfonate/bicarbonate transport system substrate-binding protein